MFTLTAAGALLGLALLPRILDTLGDSAAAVNPTAVLTVLIPAALGATVARRPAFWLRGRVPQRGSGLSAHLDRRAAPDPGPHSSMP
ncbi:hypothetical protein [Streptomyces sp. NPDC057623]|uniref:hypothetical protein n=1 Tax=Streptomyces sp. NPDC057623 TaxID=3346187 RepID=UPI0036CD9093